VDRMGKRRGLFVVIEGIDGSGTTTQAETLHNYLSNKGLSVLLTHEPTDEPVGKLIRDSLSGRISSPTTAEKIRFSEQALCLLFAADRIEHSRAVEAARSRGRHVVCDRYVHSSIAYQSLDPAIPPKRVVDVNAGCSVPDITFFLRVPIAECLARLKNRKDIPTIYEKRSILEKIDRNYHATRRLYERKFGPVVEIDGSLAAGQVHSAIVKALSPYLSARRGS
jgi:dTMP kinase